MNTPIKKYYDSEGNKQYTGDIVALHPNRKQRRLAFQKSENNPLYGVSFHQHTIIGASRSLVYKTYLQTVWNKTKEKFSRIVHLRYI
jgi:hypothetical protein